MVRRAIAQFLVCLVASAAASNDCRAEGIIGVTLSTERGPARVQTVAAGSPAETAGLIAGDEIIDIDGRRVHTSAEVIAAVNSKNPGDELRVRVADRTKDLVLTITVAARGTAFQAYQPSAAEMEAVAELKDVYANFRTDPRVSGGRVASAELAWSRINVRTFRYLSGLSALRSLTIITDGYEREIDLQWLTPLREIKTLTELRLVGPGITDEFVAACGPLSAVRTLKLEKAKVTDAVTRRLVDGHANWTVLSFRDSPVGDASLEPLKDCQDLEVLDLWGTKVTGSGLAHLEDLKHLRELDLDHSAFTSEHAIHLAPLTSLEMLDLSHTAVGDGDLKHLTGLAKLEFLGLNNTGQIPPKKPRRGGIGGGFVDETMAEMSGQGVGGAEAREQGATCQGVIDTLSGLSALRELQIVGPECIPGEKRDMARIWPRATIRTSNGDVTPNS